MEDANSQFLNPKNILEQINLEKGDFVGDFGCGTGYMSFEASKTVGRDGRVFAIDVQRSVLEQVKKEAKEGGFENISVVWADLEAVGASGIEENSLDAVFLVNTLFLVKNKKEIFKEAKRLIKQSGLVLVVDWSDQDFKIGPSFEKRVNPSEIEKTAQEVGFSREKDIFAGKYHFGMVLKSN